MDCLEAQANTSLKRKLSLFIKALLAAVIFCLSASDLLDAHKVCLQPHFPQIIYMIATPCIIFVSSKSPMNEHASYPTEQGEMTEWTIVPVLKTGAALSCRGFESLSLLYAQ